MTTLAAWIGIDQRAPASIYLVSDSRFLSVVPGSEARPRLLTDEGQKIFACKQEPHLLGYWGWVVFPSAAIARAVAAIDHEDFFASVDDAKVRSDKFSNFIV